MKHGLSQFFDAIGRSSLSGSCRHCTEASVNTEHSCARIDRKSDQEELTGCGAWHLDAF
jgi:hypothetical protein